MEHILDDLERIAVILDPDGRIGEVNRPFVESGQVRGLPSSDAWIGTSYMDLTWRAARARVDGARQTGLAIEAVLAGKVAGAEVGYPCDAPNLPAWKTVAVRELPQLGGALLVHFDTPDPRALRASERRLTEVAFRLIFGIETRCAWCRRIAGVNGAWSEREPRDRQQVSDGLCPSCDEQIVATLDRRLAAIA